jgi:hypothetical protein
MLKSLPMSKAHEMMLLCNFRFEMETGSTETAP